jgi:hypothetical protein
MKSKAKTAKAPHVPVVAKKCVHFFKCIWNDDCEDLAKAELSNMSSEELEAMGRRYGIELDRRLVKTTLVNQLYEVM